MKLLVIGGTRFVGPAIVRRALERGDEVLVYHRGMHHSGRDPDVPHLHGSTLQIGDHHAEIQAFAPEAVIDTTQFRTDTTASVIATIKDFSERYVLVSSGDVYRGYGVFHGTEEGPLQEMPVDEDAALRTRPSLDQTEVEDNLFAERAALGQRTIPSTVLRAPAIFGPGDPQERIEKHVKILHESDEHLVRTEEQAAWRFGYGHVDDVADALLLCALDRGSDHHTYNVAYPNGISRFELFAAVAGAIGWDGRMSVSAEADEQDGNHAQHIYVDSSRIRAELGYAERVSLEEAVRRAVQST